MGPVRRFGVTQQSHHLAYDIQLWWRLGGSGLEFAITRQRRIKSFLSGLGLRYELFPKEAQNACLIFSSELASRGANPWPADNQPRYFKSTRKGASRSPHGLSVFQWG